MPGFHPDDYRIVAAPIITMDPALPRADAMAMRGSRIVAVGELADAQAACPSGTRVQSVTGGYIVPGLIDAHLHLQRGGLKALALLEPDASAETFIEVMKRTALDEVWPGGEPTIAERVEGLTRVQPLMHALGITGVIDPAVTDEEMRGYQEARRTGALTLRVVAMPYPNVGTEDEPDIDGAIERLSGIGVSTGFGDDHLRIGGIKVYFDGEGMKGQALLSAPWSDSSDYRGHQRIGTDDFRRLVEFCASHSWSMGVHAVGGEAVSRVLDAFEAVDARSPIRDLRIQLIHAYLEPSAESIARAARLGVVAALQPSIHWNNGSGLIEKLGDRAVAANPIRRWIDAGATVALGSDGPFFPFDPRQLMWQSRSRRIANAEGAYGPEEAISGAEALAGYTTAAAYASFAENDRGALRAGMYADWTALSVDPITCTPDELRQSRVLQTVVGGTTVFRAPARPASSL